METNSIYSDSNKKEEERPGELIKESIADSLDKQSP